MNENLINDLLIVIAVLALATLCFFCIRINAVSMKEKISFSKTMWKIFVDMKNEIFGAQETTKDFQKFSEGESEAKLPYKVRLVRYVLEKRVSPFKNDEKLTKINKFLEKSGIRW